MAQIKSCFENKSSFDLSLITMRNFFPLFQSHLDLAHSYWQQFLEIGDVAIDATCGNGYDTLKLCQLALSSERGKIYAFDIQLQAIHSASRLVETHLSQELRLRVDFQHRCHSTFPEAIQPGSVKLIVYNLGYLPGGNKGLSTQKDITLQSMYQAQRLLQPGGIISVTCYPGHPEGVKEQEAILTYSSGLSPKEWSCCHHVWLNRKQAPSLLLIQKHSNPITVR
jgi:Putative rRNA methylase